MVPSGSRPRLGLEPDVQGGSSPLRLKIGGVGPVAFQPHLDLVQPLAHLQPPGGALEVAANPLSDSVQRDLRLWRIAPQDEVSTLGLGPAHQLPGLDQGPGFLRAGGTPQRPQHQHEPPCAQKPHAGPCSPRDDRHTPFGQEGDIRFRELLQGLVGQDQIRALEPHRLHHQWLFPHQGTLPGLVQPLGVHRHGGGPARQRVHAIDRVTCRIHQHRRQHRRRAQPSRIHDQAGVLLRALLVQHDARGRGRHQRGHERRQGHLGVHLHPAVRIVALVGDLEATKGFLNTASDLFLGHRFPHCLARAKGNPFELPQQVAVGVVLRRPLRAQPGLSWIGGPHVRRPSAGGAQNPFLPIHPGLGGGHDRHGDRGFRLLGLAQRHPRNPQDHHPQRALHRGPPSFLPAGTRSVPPIFPRADVGVDHLAVPLGQEGEPHPRPLALGQVQLGPLADHFPFRVDDFLGTRKLELEAHPLGVVARLDELREAQALLADIGGPGHIRHAPHVLVQVDVDWGPLRLPLLAHLVPPVVLQPASRLNQAVARVEAIGGPARKLSGSLRRPRGALSFLGSCERWTE
ncbi:hypothetical protein STIAU_1948 [Stigmatella aurantiaca DW4/3-1]|uniref:Uncharacterized protein n=1 Tax=Stigmatella aurantiaca (strain DW4/3-1) TaxID=378806 RepID=Q091T9_STIAD|nr:hypothetical protein STIAU_1948 [Stigmatella aurantiaca DW4/3-1]